MLCTAQDLYENELKTKDKLANRLFKANEKVAESKAVLKYVAPNDTRILSVVLFQYNVS